MRHDRRVETAAVGCGMSESGVDDVRIVDSIDQLMNADPGKQTFFAKEAIVGYAVEFEQVVEHPFVFGQAREDGAARAVFRGDEAMRVLEIDRGDGERSGGPGEKAWLRVIVLHAGHRAVAAR